MVGKVGRVRFWIFWMKGLVCFFSGCYYGGVRRVSFITFFFFRGGISFLSGCCRGEKVENCCF